MNDIQFKLSLCRSCINYIYVGITLTQSHTYEYSIHIFIQTYGVYVAEIELQFCNYLVHVLHIF